MSRIFILCALLLIIGFSSQTFASSASSTNFQQSIIFPSPAFCQPGGTYETIAVSIKNTVNFTITAIVFGVLHNLTNGQTLQVSTGTAALGAGQNVTVYDIINLQYGNYSTDVFVWSVNGSSLSSEQSNVLIAC
jgi:hypothetical protein